MLNVDIKVTGNVSLSRIRQRLAIGGPVQTLLDRLIVDYSIPYVPFETGTLSRSPYAVTAFGQGEVIYPGPYAHYQYMGEVYGPNIPFYDSDNGILVGFFSPKGERKKPTGRKISYKTTMNPLAGPFWIDRMKADRMNDILLAIGKCAVDVK